MARFLSSGSTNPSPIPDLSRPPPSFLDAQLQIFALVARSLCFLLPRLTKMTIMTIVSISCVRFLMPKLQWTVAEAKAKFSDVLDRAHSRGPQAITRNGQLTAVIVSAEEWERKTRRVGNLAEFFAASPLRNSNLQLERVQDSPRELDL